MFSKKNFLSKILLIVCFLLGSVFLFGRKTFAQTAGCVSPGTYGDIYLAFDGTERAWLYHCGELNFSFVGAFEGSVGSNPKAEVKIKPVGQPESAYIDFVGLYEVKAVDTDKEGNPINGVSVVGRLGRTGFGDNACIPPGDYDLLVKVFNEGETHYCSRERNFRVVATVCNGADSKWLDSPAGKDPIIPSKNQKLVSSAEIGNKAGNGWGTFNMYLNGWEFSCPIVAGTTCSAEEGSAWLDTTVKFEDIEKPGILKVTTSIPINVGFPYSNNLKYEWTDGDGQSSSSCSLGATFKVDQASLCSVGTTHEWLLTTGKTPYTPGSIAVTSIKLIDSLGITDDISFYFDGWEFKYGEANSGWAKGSQMTVTGKSGDTERIVTMRLPIVSNHADGWHRINYSWVIKDSSRMCSARNMIIVSNPGFTSAGSMGGGMPKTGLFDEGNKMIILGVGLVILGITWTFIFRIIRKSREAYLSISAKVSGKVSKISNQISKEVKVAKARTAKKKVENRRSRFEKRI